MDVSIEIPKAVSIRWKRYGCTVLFLSGILVWLVFSGLLGLYTSFAAIDTKALGSNKANVVVLNTQLAHDEVIVPLLSAWSGVPKVSLTAYHAGYRFGMDALVAHQLPHIARIPTYYAGDLRKAGQERAHPIPDLIVLTTCLKDILALNDTFDRLLHDHHTHLICVLHHADRLQEERWKMETTLSPWIRADRLDFLTLSPHVADTALKTKLNQEWIVVKDEHHTPRLHVLAPVFNFQSDTALTNRHNGREGGLSLQGEYQKGRDYTTLFKQLALFLRDAEERGEPADSINLHLVGYGRHPEVPQEIERNVIFDERLDYIDFYTTLLQSDLVLTAFSDEGYYTVKATSSVPAALIAGTPLIADKRLLESYAYLNETIVWMQNEGETEIDAVGRILKKPKAERDAKKAAVKAYTSGLVLNNKRLAAGWTDEIVKGFSIDM